jgi:hypothetical protein
VSARRNTLLASAFILLLAVGAILFFLRPASPKSAALSARERLMEILGAEIAKVRPQAKVLLLSNPFAEKAGAFNEKRQFERAGIRGLERGLGKGSSVTVVFPEIRPEYLTNPESISIPPDSKTPLSFLVQPASIERLAQAHPECNVIVSLIGLPIGMHELTLWNQKDPRAFALLMPDLRVIGPPNETLAAFQRGKVLAAVYQDASSAPLVVTQTNIARVLAEHPGMLGY